MDFSLSVTVLVLCFVLSFIYYVKKHRCSDLPGPRGYPFIGNLLDVDLSKIHLRLFDWSKTYGDIFQMKLFGQTFVIVNSSKILRELFTKEPNATLTSARPETFIKRYVLSDVDVVATSLDKEWTRRRKLIYKLINAYGEGLQHIEQEITDKLNEIRQELLDSKQLTFDPRDLVEDFVVSIIEILLVGKSHERGSSFHKYIISLDDAVNNVATPGVDVLFNNLPFLRFLPLQASKEYLNAVGLRDGLLAFLDKQLDNNAAGIYPTMLEFMKDQNDGSKQEIFLTKKMIESMLINILGGAFLTTRGMLLSLIRILMVMPNVQAKLQQEVDRVVGRSRPPSLKDRNEMPYTEAVILETLRFISHLPTSLFHSTSGDVTVGNFLIPKGTMIIPNLWTMHHSETEWTDPFKFDPERFLTETGDILAADHEIRKQFVGFGLGKRSCIGEVLAKSRIFLFMTTLMQEYTVLPPDGETYSMLDPREMMSGIIMTTYPYRCKFKERND